MAKQNASLSVVLQNRIIEFFHHYHPMTKPGPLLVAVSGGPDSLCLFHLLHDLRNTLGIKIHVVHLDHRLRGEESAGDAHFVREIARRYHIPATIEGRDVQEYRTRHHLSLEEAAREVRYTFFAETAKSIQASAVAVGHTMDDNVETILMHLVRGTGTRGLCGLPPVTKWHSSKEGLTVIRPLLDTGRQETMQYCQDKMIETRTDKSNASLDFLRNRIRLELRPMLERYNPKINEALLKMAAIAGDEIEFLDNEVQRLWKSTAKKQENSITFSKSRLISQPTAIKRYLLRAATAELSGNPKDIESRHIEEMIALLEKPAGSRINLPYGLVFSVEYNRFLLGPEPAVLCPLPLLESETVLNIPGETRYSGWRITARIFKVKGPDTIKNRKPIKATLKNSDKIPRAGFSAYFDMDLLGDNLKVRESQTGDRFQPYGLAGMKKVARFMIDARIPRSWRPRIPIVVASQQVAWVTGWRTDDRFKITGATKKILKLHFRLQ